MHKRTWIVGLLLVLLMIPFVASPAAASPASWGCGPGVTYVVRPGDNLFRIALNHGTTMQAIASANGIYNYALVYAGSVLKIPCAGGYTPPVYQPPVYQPPVYQPPVYQPPVYQPPVYQPPVWHPPVWHPPAHQPPVYQPPVYASCHQLYGTSPLGGMNYGDQTFYWNPVGATSYRVNVYSVDVNPGNLVASGEVSGPQTNITLNVGAPAGHGFQFSWEVKALVNGVVVCTSPRYTMYRAAP